MNEHYVTRTMTSQEVDLAIDWAAREGWNPGLHDAHCYPIADPNGFLAGLLDGRLIASLSAVRYDKTFGFLGFYMVTPEYRGQGYGIRLWDAGMRYLQGCTIGLDGVVEQQANYARSGFRLAYRNVRYQGSGGGEAPADPDIVPLSSLPFAAVAAYDAPFFPADRSAFLKDWIGQPQGHALGILRAGTLAGYGVMRRCRAGYKIGPLFADTPELAEKLFLALRTRAGADEPVFLDVPECNSEAVKLCERHAMTVGFETARMYRGEAPDISLSRTFGVTSFEIG